MFSTLKLLLVIDTQGSNESELATGTPAVWGTAVSGKYIYIIIYLLYYDLI